MDERYRQQLFQNAENRFFYSSKTNTIHDRLCKSVNDIDERHLYVIPDLTKEYIKGKRLCPHCRRKLAVRMGMVKQLRSQTRYYSFFMHFFAEVGAQTEDLVKLFVWNEGSLSYVSDDCVQIRVKEDTWRICHDGDGVGLYHNNYEVNLDCTRTFSNSFHKQFDNNDPSFKNLANIICTYTFNYHRRKAEQYARKVNEEKLQAQLAIVDNYAVVEKKSLLHYYFTFVDIGNRATEDQHPCFVDSLREINSEEHCDYSLVTCRVPKWRKDEFLRAMNSLKSYAFTEARYDYPGLCEELVPQAV